MSTTTGFYYEFLFLSTPSARRATHHHCYVPPRHWISIHALREEGDQAASPEAIQPKEFLSTPSARRATQEAPELVCNLEISIHALREEGDVEATLDGLTQYDFYPRPPRGGRPACRDCKTCRTDFYPRPPRGGRLLFGGLASGAK